MSARVWYNGFLAIRSADLPPGNPMSTQTRRPRKSKTETETAAAAAAQTTDITPGKPKRTGRAAAMTIRTPATEPIAEPIAKPMPDPAPAPEPDPAPAARPEPIAPTAKRARKAKPEPVVFDPAELAPAGQ